MLPQYKSFLGLIAYKNLCKSADMPAVALAVAGTDKMDSVNSPSFTTIAPVYKTAELNYSVATPYEQTAANGAGDALTQNNFVTDNFNIGNPYGEV